MSNHLSHLAKHRFRRKKGATSQIAAQLAPLEEQKKLTDGNGRNSSLAHQEVGAIVVEGDAADLSKDLAEVSEGSGRRGLEPVVLVILIVLLSYIAFITWQISTMAEK